jgi:hypothetical protein
MVAAIGSLARRGFSSGRRLQLAARTDALSRPGTVTEGRFEILGILP